MTRRAAKGQARDDSPRTPIVIPLKPRKGLFILSLCVFAGWVAVLLLIYFKTIWPHRHDPPRQEQKRDPVLAQG